MSSTDDDDRDGLASLFGGITPHGAPTPGSGRRRASAEPREESRDEPQQARQDGPKPSARPSAEASLGVPLYPGLAPSGFDPVAQPSASSAPAYPPPPASPPPASAPSAPPAYPLSAHTPPAYPTPAEPPPQAATGAFGEPAAPEHDAPAPPPVYGQPYVPPAYAPPVTPAEPQPRLVGAPTPFGTPSYDLPAPSYDLPPPAAPLGVPPAPSAAPAHLEPQSTHVESPSTPSTSAPSAHPAPGYPGLAYPGLAPASTAYPPTVQYPAGTDASSPSRNAAPPAAQASDPVRSTIDAPMFHPPVGEPPQLSEPSQLGEPLPLSEPPRSGGGFAVLGLEPVAAASLAAAAPPESAPAQSGESLHARPADQPAAAVVESASRRERSAPVLRRPPGPLLPVESAVVEVGEDLERSTTAEKIGLVVAVVGGPIGLVFAIVTGIRGVRRRGWLTRVGRATLVLAVLSTIAVGIGAAALWNARMAQMAHAEVAAASAEFCAAAAEHPEIAQPPLLGWPDSGATIPESLTLMQEWTARWTDLAAGAPAGLRPGLELLATRGGEVVTAVEQSRIVDEDANERLIGSAASSSGVADWHSTYCVSP